MAENNLRDVSLDRINDAVRTYGLQKQLAGDLMISDTELSRILHEQAPRVVSLLSKLGLEVVHTEYVSSLKKVLKETL